MNREQIINILSEVKDPEIPVLTIADLGILRSVEYANDLIEIQITPTYSGCPAMEYDSGRHSYRTGETRIEPG